MVSRYFQRRAVLAGMAATAFIPSVAQAEDYIDLDWEDLLPENETKVPNALRGLTKHGSDPLSSQQPESSGVRADWNGKIVRLPGFIVPIDLQGTGVTAFLLVPYVGACVHVPPPPANQLVFVTTETPYENKRLFEPVNVIGMFGIASISTHAAEVGYALSADRIEPFRQ